MGSEMCIRDRLKGLAEDAKTCSVLSSGELGLAFGRETVIHAALLEGGVTKRVLREAARLEGFRLEADTACDAP